MKNANFLITQILFYFFYCQCYFIKPGIPPEIYLNSGSNQSINADICFYFFINHQLQLVALQQIQSFSHFSDLPLFSNNLEYAIFNDIYIRSG